MPPWTQPWKLVTEDFGAESKALASPVVAAQEVFFTCTLHEPKWSPPRLDNMRGVSMLVFTSEELRYVFTGKFM